MTKWYEVKKRWLPLVEEMERHNMDDHAIPEIYRAAEREIISMLTKALERMEENDEQCSREYKKGRDRGHREGRNEAIEEHEKILKILELESKITPIAYSAIEDAIRKHKGEGK